MFLFDNVIGLRHFEERSRPRAQRRQDAEPRARDDREPGHHHRRRAHSLRQARRSHRTTRVERATNPRSALSEPPKSTATTLICSLIIGQFSGLAVHGRRERHLAGQNRRPTVDGGGRQCGGRRPGGRVGGPPPLFCCFGGRGAAGDECGGARPRSALVCLLGACFREPVWWGHVGRERSSAVPLRVREPGGRVRVEASHPVTRQPFRRGPTRGPAGRLIPGRRELRERRAVLSVQLARTGYGTVLMVRRGSPDA
jgi:hypothetical protein